MPMIEQPTSATLKIKEFLDPAAEAAKTFSNFKEQASAIMNKTLDNGTRSLNKNKSTAVVANVNYGSCYDSIIKQKLENALPKNQSFLKAEKEKEPTDLSHNLEKKQ